MFIANALSFLIGCVIQTAQIENTLKSIILDAGSKLNDFYRSYEMGSNRYQKPAPPQYAPKEERNKKPDEIILTFKPCCVCGKAIVTGYFARWGNGGTCGIACEKLQANKPKEIDNENFVPVTSFAGAIFSPR